MSKKHARSRSGLTRCPSCRAHVRAAESPTETVCPFCGAALTGAPSRMASAGRGGVLAASLLAFSCGGGSGAAEPEEQPTVVNEPPVGVVEPSDNQNEEEAQEQDDFEEAEEPVAVEAYGVAPAEPPRPPPVPAYGVAPGPRRP